MGPSVNQKRKSSGKSGLASVIIRPAFLIFARCKETWQAWICSVSGVNLKILYAAAFQFLSIAAGLSFDGSADSELSVIDQRTAYICIEKKRVYVIKH